jgi:hypothetical protein
LNECPFFGDNFTISKVNVLDCQENMTAGFSGRAVGDAVSVFHGHRSGYVMKAA